MNRPKNMYPRAPATFKYITTKSLSHIHSSSLALARAAEPQKRPVKRFRGSRVERRSETAADSMLGARIWRAGIVGNHVRKGGAAGVDAHALADKRLPAICPRRCQRQNVLMLLEMEFHGTCRYR